AALTEAGILLGTAAYMSPEQARGKAVDKRTDIWAFGCVLFEMLTGRSPFSGETVSDTIAAILGREPAWDALPAETPAPVRRLLRRCLERDPKRRLHDIADARIEIDDLQNVARSDASVAPPPPASRSRERSAWIVAAIAVIGAVAIVVWQHMTLGEGARGSAGEAGDVVRLSVVPPPGLLMNADSANV